MAYVYSMVSSNVELQKTLEPIDHLQVSLWICMELRAAFEAKYLGSEDPRSGSLKVVFGALWVGLKNLGSLKVVFEALWRPSWSSPG